MRTTRAKLLLMLAFLLVILVEIRTVLAFFGVDIGPRGVIALGVVSIGALFLWAFFPSAEGGPGG